MSTIRETVEKRLAFHGVNGHTDVVAAVIDSLEQREAQIQADLLRHAEAAGMEEDDVLGILHDVFSHQHSEDEATFDTVLARIGILTAALSEQTALLHDINQRDLIA